MLSYLENDSVSVSHHAFPQISPSNRIKDLSVENRTFREATLDGNAGK